MIAAQPHEILALQKAGRAAAEALRIAKNMIKSGMTTLELDKIVADVIAANGCLPAFKGHKGYQFASCISINSEVVHGVPSADRIIEEGDLVSIDTGATCDGHYSDTAISLAIPPASYDIVKLVEKTERALKAGIQAAQMGMTIGHISRAIRSVISGNGPYTMIKHYSGHSLGKELHETPQVPNEMIKGESFEDPPFNVILEPGMILALEPMICLGASGETFTKEDGWTIATVDNSIACHFEHTIQITTFGPVILTEIK